MRKFWIVFGCLIALLSLYLNLLSAQSNCDVSETEISLEAGQRLAECGNYEAAISVLTQSLNNTSDEVERATIQMTLGAVYYEAGNYFDAQVAYERAFITYNANDMPAEAGRAYTGAGLAKVGRRLFDEAFSYFNEALRRSESAGDTVNLANTHYAITQLHFRAGNYDDALTSSSEALAYYRQNDDQPNILKVLRLHVELYLAQGNLLAAFTTLDEGIEIARAIGADADLAPMLLQLAQARIINGQYADAINYLLEAETLYNTLDDDTGQLLVWIALSDVYTRQGNYPDAQLMLRNAGRAAQDLTDCPILMQYNNARGNIYNATGLYENAITTFTDTVNIECANENIRLVARAQLGLGQAWLSRGYTVFGGDEFQFALGNFRNTNDPVGEVDALLLLSGFFLRRNQVSNAYDYAFTASTIAEETGNTDGLIRAEFALANIDLREGAFDNGVARLEGALGLAIENNNLAMQAFALEQIADVYFNQARYEEAIQFWERAQDAFGGEDNTRYQAQLTFNRGLILEATGDIAQALITYEAARDLFAEIDERQSVIRIDLTIGELYIELNLFDQAEPYFSTALTMADTTGNTGLRADALTSLGRLDLRRMDFAEAQQAPLSDTQLTALLDSAEARFFEAYNIYLEIENPSGQARVLNELGLLGIRRLIPAQFGTGGFFLTALELSRDTNNILLEADVLSNLGYYNEIVGQSGQAITYYQQALTIADVLNPVLATRLRIRLGILYERRGETANANRYYNEAIDALESLYILLGSQSDQTQFGSQLTNLLPYERMIRYYGLNIVDGREQDATTALNYVERSRARSLLFQLSSEGIEFSQAENTALNEWQATRDTLLELYADLDIARQQEVDTTAITTEIAELEAELATLQDSGNIQSLLQVLTINTVELADLQASLPDASAMLVYHISPETRTEYQSEAGRIFTFVITRDSIVQVPTRIESYQDEVVNLINLFRRNPNNADALTRLYTVLIEPITDAIQGVDNLIIVPHDVLNYLPFEALRDENGGYLVDNFNISYSPSATIYTLLQQRSTVSTDGDKLILNYGEDLIYAREEAEMVASTLGVTSLHDTNATESTIRELAENASVIHVAAHGEFNPQQALESYLSLAADDTNDGLFTVREIYSLNLQEYNPLVVLSACNTAVSDVNPGDEFQNMTRAFLLVGARSVIASLWAVDDVATSELMVAFYSNRVAGMSDAEALAEAKRTVQENFPNPYFWAGFVLIGTG